MLTFRYAAACLLMSACVSLTAAPVPKRPAPKVLTAEMLTGTWSYEYGQMLDGVITFDANGSYVGIHIPGSDSIYSGEWKVEDDAVILTEWRHDLVTNGRTGPATYKFQFKAADYPKLKGLSNGATHVALTRARQ